MKPKTVRINTECFLHLMNTVWYHTRFVEIARITGLSLVQVERLSDLAPLQRDKKL